jgi:hypothetical protein
MLDFSLEEKSKREWVNNRRLRELKDMAEYGPVAK